MASTHSHVSSQTQKEGRQLHPAVQSCYDLLIVHGCLLKPDLLDKIDFFFTSPLKMEPAPNRLRSRKREEK